MVVGGGPFARIRGKKRKHLRVQLRLIILSKLKIISLRKDGVKGQGRAFCLYTFQLSTSKRPRG
jgi:hypothetical protein